MDEYVLLDNHRHTVITDVFHRCKGGLIEVIETEIQPAYYGWFDEIDQLIDEFKEKIEAQERVQNNHE